MQGLNSNMYEVFEHQQIPPRVYTPLNDSMQTHGLIVGQAAPIPISVRLYTPNPLVPSGVVWEPDQLYLMINSPLTIQQASSIVLDRIICDINVNFSNLGLNLSNCFGCSTYFCANSIYYNSFKRGRIFQQRCLYSIQYYS